MKPQSYSSLSEWVKYLRPFHKDKTVKQVTELAKQIKSKTQTVKTQPKSLFKKVLINNASLGFMAGVSAGDNNRKIRNWGRPEAVFSWWNKGDYRSEDCGQYSRNCRYTKWSYHPQYTSFVTIGDSGRGAVYSYGFKDEKKSKFIRAPKGMKFDIDDLGLKLVRETDNMDYHPNYNDLLAKNFSAIVRREMAENYKQRLRGLKILREKRSLAKKYVGEIVPKTYVNFTDARRAGNCVQGILNWVSKNIQIDEKQMIESPWLVQVPAKLLNRIAPNNPLVFNSINQAYLRETAVCI